MIQSHNSDYAISVEGDIMRESLYDFCMHYDRNELLIQWNQKKNEDLSPKQISHGSHRKVWWKCGKRHEW